MQKKSSPLSPTYTEAPSLFPFELPDFLPAYSDVLGVWCGCDLVSPGLTWVSYLVSAYSKNNPMM